MSEPTTLAFPVPTRDAIREMLRAKILEAVHVVLDEEVTAVLGTGPYERGQERRGYRHGKQRRRVTTECGPVEVEMPRARLRSSEGGTREFRSVVLPRYARRTRRVDEAILGAYLAGANTRRIRKALEPLLGEAHLSRSAVSRVVGRLKEQFTRWSTRDLSEESCGLLFLDALHVKVRLARRVVSVPVLVALGVDEEGRKHLVALQLAVSESGASWGGLVQDLGRRGLPEPVLVISDGHPGLTKAIQLWPGASVQRCTQHKLQNLLDHCPAHARGELTRDYRQITHAGDGIEARKAYDSLRRKWTTLCPAVVRSLDEAGEQLLTFTQFPREMWKSIRTTNTIENLNREFRRRTKTQASFSNEPAAVTLLYGLIAFGQIRLRRIDGYRHLPKTLATLQAKAA